MRRFSTFNTKNFNFNRSIQTSSVPIVFAKSKFSFFHFDPTATTENFPINNKYGSALSKRMEAKQQQQEQQQKSQTSSSSSSSGTVPPRPQNIVIEELNLVEQTLPCHIRKLHDEAVARGETNYTDPDTGYFVFSRLAHINRGKCCGSACRHCPYGHVNVSAERKLFLQLQAQKNISNNNKNNKTSCDVENISVVNNNNNDAVIDDGVVNESVPVVAQTKLTNTGKETGVVFTRTGDKGTSGLFSGERRSKSDNIFDVVGTIDELSSNIGLARVECNIYLDEEKALKSSKEVVEEKEAEPSEAAAASTANVIVIIPRRLLISVKQDLEWIQERLMDCGSLIAMLNSHQNNDEGMGKEKNSSSDLLVEQGTSDWVKRLERTIEQQTSSLPPLTNFILPSGGCRASAQLHICRSVCRRAERCVWREISRETTRLVALHKQQEQQNHHSDDDEAIEVNSDHLIRCRSVAKFLNRLSDFMFTSARSYEKR